MITSDRTNAKPDFLELKVDQIHPNQFNPNRMSEDEFEELVNEVERLGRPAKPTVVRQTEHGYEIVDGEHNWRAAKDLGIEKIMCEVLEADDFESMRQCYKRNRGGTDEPIALGRMFKRMLEEKQLTNRQLAEELDTTEGTIRNNLEYVRAYELRNSYAAENRALAGITPDAQSSDNEDVESVGVAKLINELPVRQVRLYLKLPAEIRNYWLDAGAPTKLFNSIEKDDGLLNQIAEIGLAIPINSPAEFTKKFNRTRKVAEWVAEHEEVQDAIEYAKKYQWFGLSPDGLRCLPITRDGKKIAINLETWGEIVEAAYYTFSDESPHVRRENVTEVCQFVYESVLKKLDEIGLYAWDVSIEYQESERRFLERAPDFIREAENLTFGQIKELVDLYGHRSDVPNCVELIRNAITELQEAYENGSGENADSIRRLRRYLQHKFLSKTWQEKNEAILQNDKKLVNRVLELLDNKPDVIEVMSQFENGHEILQQKINHMDPATLAMLFALIDNHPMSCAVEAMLKHATNELECATLN